MPSDAENWRLLQIGRTNLYVLEIGPYRFGYIERGCSLDELAEQQKPFPKPWHFLHQVHSAEIWEPSFSSSFELLHGDGWFVRRPGGTAWIKTADCVPLFFCVERPDPCGGILHVGWRGLQKGIIENLQQKLEQNECHLDTIRIFLGPAIGPSCYQVKYDLRNLFLMKPWAAEVFRPDPSDSGSYLFDLKAGIIRTLEAIGVHRGQIHDVSLCTHCLPERFPSYRRDGKTGERIYSFFYFQ